MILLKKRVLILGAYGNFGLHITDQLIHESNIQLILSGRSQEKCENLLNRYLNSAVKNIPELAVFDITGDLKKYLYELKPDIVVHTCGPFQAQSYSVAQVCISVGCHYVDLADGRTFVSEITNLNEAAKAKNVSIISGASSVPCLTAAVIDKYQSYFKKIQSVESGIATSQRVNVGLATTRGTLSYCGLPIMMWIDNRMQTVYGWQGLVSRVYPILGKRYFSYCDVPDLPLFPERYQYLSNYEFRVSLEVPLIHWVMWILSWLVRIKLIRKLSNWAAPMRKIAHWFDKLGSNDSGFHVILTGKDFQGNEKKIKFYLIAFDCYGPYIPSMPAILCAKKLADNKIIRRGAYPCLDVITLAEYLSALDSTKIKIIVSDK